MAFIPRTIRELKGDTFVYCYKLTTVIFEDDSDIQNLAHYTFCCSNIINIIFPSSAKTISSKSFAGCKNLKSITITGFLLSSNKDIFEDAASDIKIYVPINYPSNQFGERSVIKNLPAYYPTLNHLTCKQALSRKESSIPFIFPIFHYSSS